VTSTTYEPATALIVVDVQHDFGDPAGSLYVSGGEEVLPVVDAEIGAARAAGSPVYYTQDWHPEHTPHFARDGGIWPVHCVAGTPGADFLPGLRIVGEVMRKGGDGEDGYSGFSVRDPRSGATRPTRLGSLLEAAGVERVVVVGLAGDWCVKETALDAVRGGWPAVVPLAATRFVELHPGDTLAALADLRAAGVTVTGSLVTGPADRPALPEKPAGTG
jgi:nicotinamidase/pyrazinamidase